MLGSKCIYSSDSKLLKVIADKNKINVVFSYSLLNIIFIVMVSFLVRVFVFIWQKLNKVFRFSQFPNFGVAGILAFTFLFMTTV